MADKVKPDGAEPVAFGAAHGGWREVVEYEDHFRRSTILRVIDEEIDRWQVRYGAIICTAALRELRARLEEATDD